MATEGAPVHPARIGCSGWNYDSWRGELYPAGLGKPRWLGCYATRFDTVEVNSTFYRLASEKAVERWVEQTPPGFVFAVKASRYLTHIRRLKDMRDGVARFMAPLGPLVESGRFGPVLWQLPPNFRRDDELLAAALAELPAARNTFEFRDPSWFHPDVARRRIQQKPTHRDDDPAARNSLYWVERPLAARFKKSGPGSEIATVERREAGVPIAK